MTIENLLPNEKTPNKIFLTGVPGSRWSGIAQEIEDFIDADCSDRKTKREYSHEKFSGHKGAYFGTGMEFPADFSETNLDAPYICEHRMLNQCRVHKSHEWAYVLDDISRAYREDWIILVYRDSKRSFDWWKEAGGWDIKYPDYSWYVNDSIMMKKIQEQNELILYFAKKNNLLWKQHHTFSDIFLSVWT